MARTLPILALALLSGGCVITPLPDGSRIERLAGPASSAAPVLSAEESRRLAELNARILAEQEAVREREARLDAWREAHRQWSFDLTYGRGWPYRSWYGGWPYWGGTPRWSWGLGVYQPFP